MVSPKYFIWIKFKVIKTVKVLINSNLNVLTAFFRDRKTRQLKGYMVDVVNAGEYTR